MTKVSHQFPSSVLVSSFRLFILLSLSLLPSTLYALPVTTYDQLLKAIRETRNSSQQRIEQAVRQEKVREAWEIGKLIDEHILQRKERADYGKQVLGRLGKDLEISQTELSLMLQFARAYPIYSHANKLSWSEYRELLSLNDEMEREEVTQKAEKEKWNRDQIREEVRKRKAARREREVNPEARLIPSKLGKLNTYKIIKATTGPLRGRLVIDLGFSNYFEIRESDYVTPGPSETLHENDVVQITFAKKYSLVKTTAADLYTYQAYVSHVIDGDTLVVAIDLGFGAWTTQKLRLRGLDAPELVSKEGKEAKAFVEKLLGISGQRFTTAFTSKHPLIPILIKTSKSDKYDRYLADVFVQRTHDARPEAQDGPIFLNQQLLDQGLATLMEE